MSFHGGMTAAAIAKSVGTEVCIMLPLDTTTHVAGKR